MKRKTKQQGFTLIELIVVIVILGILAAVALPRFVDLQIQARQAKLQAAVGAVRAGGSLFKAQCLASLASPTPPANCNTIAMEGVNVTGVNNYPTANAGGIVTAAGLNAGAVAGPNVDYVLVGGGAAGGSTLTIRVPSPGGATCQLTYLSPAAVNASPTVTLAATACN